MKHDFFKKIDGNVTHSFSLNFDSKLLLNQKVLFQSVSNISNFKNESLRGFNLLKYKGTAKESFTFFIDNKPFFIMMFLSLATKSSHQKSSKKSFQIK